MFCGVRYPWQPQQTQVVFIQWSQAASRSKPSAYITHYVAGPPLWFNIKDDREWWEVWCVSYTGENDDYATAGNNGHGGSMYVSNTTGSFESSHRPGKLCRWLPIATGCVSGHLSNLVSWKLRVSSHVE